VNPSPTPGYDGVVERTPEGGVIRFARHLAYPIRDVWDAATDPAQLARWWLPFDAEVSIDLREGGEMVFVGRGDEPVTMTFTIRRVEAPMLLEHTHLDPGAWVRWELEPVGDGCILRLTHFLPDPDTGIERCYVVGLHTSLARLVPCLAGSPIPWDWHEFAVAQAHYAELGLAPLPSPPEAP
jgi:uncharacterized protein YndB with AHSA1/START domain